MLPPALLEGLRDLSRREGVTSFMAYLAGFQALLARYCGQTDIPVGVPVSVSDQPQLESLIGFFTNMVVFRTDLSGDPSFRALLSRVREVALGAYGHQEVPFERLVELTGARRQLSRAPLFQVALVHHLVPPVAPRLEGLSLSSFVGDASEPDALFLVESVQVNTDPTWAAVQLAAQLVAKAGGGVVSMSWGDPEVKQELGWDKYFKQPGVVYFAAAGDSGLGVSIYPGSSPNVVSVGGTYFNRDSSGKFVNEVYASFAGGGNLSPFEPRPTYQNGVSHIVGAHRGYPDVAADYCCAAVYFQGGWISVGGTSWGSPTFAGIVNAAGGKQPSSTAELTLMYKELANPILYKADFNDIKQGDPLCSVGFDRCTGIGSPRTYVGK